MKHVFLSFLLVVGAWLRPATAQAQPSGPDSLSQKLTRIFAPLDKSQVPTGYLDEAAERLLGLAPYNGVLTDSNRTELDVLRYLRAQLAACRVYGPDTLPSLPAFNARLKKALAAADAAPSGPGATIPLALMFHPYASIRPSALQDNRGPVPTGRLAPC